MLCDELRPDIFVVSGMDSIHHQNRHRQTKSPQICWKISLLHKVICLILFPTMLHFHLKFEVWCIRTLLKRLWYITESDSTRPFQKGPRVQVCLHKGNTESWGFGEIVNFRTTGHFKQSYIKSKEFSFCTSNSDTCPTIGHSAALLSCSTRMS